MADKEKDKEKVPLPELKPGDILLFSGKSLFSRLIQVKTFSKFSHVEVYLGNNLTATSKEGKGVNWYEVETENLAAVLRPETLYQIDPSEAIDYHNSCVGQSYDYWGILRFFKIGKQTTDKSFCSEHSTRVSRRLKLIDSSGFLIDYFHPFAERYDADLVSPGMFWASPHYDVIAVGPFKEN